MFNSLLRRFSYRPHGSRPGATRSSPFTSLQVMRLEDRAVPAAPVLSGAAGRAIGGWWVVTGQVIDEDPGHAHVAVSGSVSGAATVAANGAFEFITAQSGGGMVSLVATDTEGLDSFPVMIGINPPPANAAPYLSMNVSYGQRKNVMMFGHVYDEHPGGLTVNITGVATGTAGTDSTGNFSVTLEATSLGEVRGVVSDAQGLASNIATVMLASSKPQIVDYSVTITGNTLVVRGRVIDESPAGLVVQIGGTTPGAAGHTATVGDDGWFMTSFNVVNDVNQWGTITVQVTDWWGLASDVKTWDLF